MPGLRELGIAPTPVSAVLDEIRASSGRAVPFTRRCKKSPLRSRRGLWRWPDNRSRGREGIVAGRHGERTPNTPLRRSSHSPPFRKAHAPPRGGETALRSLTGAGDPRERLVGPALEHAGNGAALLRDDPADVLGPRAVEIAHDEQPDRRGARQLAGRTVDRGTYLVHRHVLAIGDLPQGIPEFRLEANAGAKAPDSDVPIAQHAILPVFRRPRADDGVARDHACRKIGRASGRVTVG